MNDSTLQPRPAARRAVILAGGASSRMPSGKPGAALWDTTLLDVAVTTVLAAGLEPIVCARPQTVLPPTSAAIWQEPASVERPHPLAAIAWCLARAEEPLVFLPVDLPRLPPDALNELVSAAGPGGPGAAVLAADGRPAALVLAVAPAHAAALAAAAAADAPVLRTLLALGAVLVEPASCRDEQALANVNTPGDLAALASGPRPHWL